MPAGVQLLIAALAIGVGGRIWGGKPWSWVPRKIGRGLVWLALAPLRRNRWR